MALTTASISALLISLAILFTGTGLQGTLISVRANFEDFSTLTIGLLQSGYYSGFIGGCLAAPYVVGRVGHIRVFAVLASLASVSALTHILHIESVTWWILRATSGLCAAGLFVVAESWLNERATNQNRGRVMSVYFIVNMSALLAGQLLLLTANPKGYYLFCLVSILISLSILPVGLTVSPEPEPIQAKWLHLGRLFRASPLGVAICFITGLANGAFWGLSPVFIQDAGLPVPYVAYFISLMIAGGALSQWPIGRFSDQHDRRRVLVAVCFGAGSSGLALAFAGANLPSGLIFLAAIYGALSMPLYSLAIAHVNDFTQPSDFVETSGGLLLIFGTGAILGPTFGSLAMQQVDYWSLFLYTALVHFSGGLYGIYRIHRRLPVAREERGEFIPVPRSTPAVFDLHPAAEDFEPRGRE